jgi:hypothetical protein
LQEARFGDAGEQDFAGSGLVGDFNHFTFFHFETSRTDEKCSIVESGVVGVRISHISPTAGSPRYSCRGRGNWSRAADAVVHLAIFLHLWADASKDISEERYDFPCDTLFLLYRDLCNESADRPFNSTEGFECVNECF